MIAAIDCHQHFWDPARVPLPWLRPEHARIARRFEPEDLEPHLAAAGVERTILVQSACAEEDTELMLAHARAHEWIAAVVAWLPLESAEQTAACLEVLASEPKLRGVRHLIHDEADPHWILQPSVLESLRLVEERGLVLELPAVWPRHLPDVPELARSFPALTIVVDHLGKPPLDADAHDTEAWARALGSAAAAGPNVAAKISGLNTATTRPDWSGADLEACVRTALDSFGADRLLCGSDWPVALLNGDYRRVWMETRRAVAAVAPQEEERLLAGTARRLYRLPDEAGDGAH
ncbi:MAG TPA: amidohydrolase family protein [Gaiellaceae bacterium]|nr:amidohydrolase family protein [Gaiellaceae bacterium]